LQWQARSAFWHLQGLNICKTIIITQMKQISVTIALLLSVSVFTVAQIAPLGKDLARQFSEKTQSYSSVEAKFLFTLENLQEGITDTHEGTLRFMGKKYSLDLMGMNLYFDGSTKWQFIPEVNEVTISQPTTLEGGFFDDPTKLFSDYGQEFNSKYIGEKHEKEGILYELELYPKDLSEPYSLIRVLLKKESLDPVLIKYQGKDGLNYII
jgi:outer membrane lipoprotein-sorting protein